MVNPPIGHSRSGVACGAALRSCHGRGMALAKNGIASVESKRNQVTTKEELQAKLAQVREIYDDTQHDLRRAKKAEQQPLRNQLFALAQSIHDLERQIENQ